MLNRKSFLLAILFAASSGAYADASHSHGPKIGAVGDVNDATRTIEVEMTDNYYDHMQISVRRGEIVRFVIHNRGQLLHEFNIGTKDMHVAHQNEMMTMMNFSEMMMMTMMRWVIAF